MSTKENGSPPGPDPAPPQFPTREEVLRKFDPANSGRDAHGRFAPGNAGGPGNPYARQVAALRKEIARFLTEEGRLHLLIERLYDSAMEGDIAAARLFLSYALGKPADAVAPDDVEAHELEVFRRTTATAADGQPMTGWPAGAWNELLARLRPVVGEALRAEFACDWAAINREYEALRPAREEEVRRATAARAAAEAPAGPGNPLTAEKVSELLRHPTLSALLRPAPGAGERRDGSRQGAQGGPATVNKRGESGRAANGPGRNGTPPDRR
jgi:hypothetical protein